MQNEIMEKLKTYKNIAILGFGREGKSTYQFIRKHDSKFPLTILDAKEIELSDPFATYMPYHGEADLKDFDLIIKTPGVPVYNFKDTTKEKITSQMELLLEVNRNNMIGITGTKGKSTTTTLIYNIFKDQMQKVFLAGNIGIPVFDQIEEYEGAIIVVEMSALQLETVHYSPHIGIVLNLFLDHLDHAGSIENYHHSKMNIIRYQDIYDYGIYDADNEYLQKQDFHSMKGNLKTVSLKEKASIYLNEHGDIYLGDEFLLNKKEIVTELKGDHNLKNILFALLTSSIYHLDLKKTLQTIKNFKPLEHRMEYVGKYEDIHFYNDVIATIPEATINACKTLKEVDTLIFGGMDRNIDYQKLVQFLNESSIGNFICMPTTGYKLAPLLDQNRVRKAETLEEAVDIAFQVTKKNHICLLSPAAASYEYFKNFEEKGKKYKELIRNRK